MQRVTNTCCKEQIDYNFVKWSTAATTSGLTAHACFPYSGITLVRVNRGAAESGLDFTYNRLLWGKYSHESVTLVMAPSSVGSVRHHDGCIYNKLPEDGSHKPLHAQARARENMIALFC